MPFRRPAELLDLYEEEFMTLMVEAIQDPEAARESCEELELSPSVVRQIRRDFRIEPVLSGVGWDSWELSVILPSDDGVGLAFSEVHGCTGPVLLGEWNLNNSKRKLAIVEAFLDDHEWPQFSDPRGYLCNHRPDLIPKSMILQALERCMPPHNDEIPEQTPNDWMAKRYRACATRRKQTTIKRQGSRKKRPVR